MRVSVLAIFLVAMSAACGTPSSGEFSRSDPQNIGSSADDGITIMPNTFNLVGMAGVETMAGGTGTITGTGSAVDLTEIDLMDTNVPPTFRFVAPTCAGQMCTFTAGMQPLPQPVQLACTPVGGMTRSAVLTARSGAFSATATANCTAMGGGAAIQVPSSVGRLFAEVGMSNSATMTIVNSGGLLESVSVVLDPASDWTAMSCVASPCSIPIGMSKDVIVVFSPKADGPRDSQLSVTSSPDAGTKVVSLLGTGNGGVLHVDDPIGPGFSHPFGTIPKGQLVTFAVKMTNTGNEDITITPSTLGAPFTVDPTPVILPGNNGMGMFNVSCQSANPGGPFDGIVNLGQSANTYARNTSSISVHCSIADTTIQVSAPLDFGELRTGDPAGSVPVMITNPPGGGDVLIQSVTLVNAPPGLTMATPMPGVPTMLADGATINTTLTLSTAADVTLTDVLLEVQVVEAQPVTLQTPVTGKVGTPSAVVVPDTLDLGTVCVGTPVTGDITMTNNGTATLQMQRPAMTNAMFNPLFVNPTDYPAPLLPGTSATVGVMPASLVAGVTTGTLEWTVDVPQPMQPFRIPVQLEYIAAGTGISPNKLAFGTIDLGTTSATQTVTLENCGTEAVLITVNDVSATRGKSTEWVISPRDHQENLLPRDKMRIMAAFAPTEPGQHVANIVLDVGGEQRLVALDGDAAGTPPIDKTSFYACNDCSGSGAPARNWPIAIAIGFVFRRRRRC